jgi:5'-AMP-activated protein kinase regulatory beta subunit
MKKNGNEFVLVKQLESGIHEYKFIVDNEWRFSPDLPTTKDEHGNINNIIDTTA